MIDNPALGPPARDVLALWHKYPQLVLVNHSPEAQEQVGWMGRAQLSAWSSPLSLRVPWLGKPNSQHQGSLAVT